MNYSEAIRNIGRQVAFTYPDAFGSYASARGTLKVVVCYRDEGIIKANLQVVVNGREQLFKLETLEFH